MEPYYERDGITIYHGDCREIMPELPAVDLLLTDPPYGLGDKWGSASKTWGNGRLWRGNPGWDVLAEFAVGYFIRNKSIVWGGNYYALPPTNSWLIWDKMQKHTSSEAEMAWTNLPQPVRVFRMSRVEAYCGHERKMHPTQKPLDLMRWCLGFTDANTILDPFMGSGTTLVAAKLECRQAIGIELEERYCEIAAKRLAQGVLF